MVDTKTSRFGRKAMSLLLSGAMVVAFAPAVGAAVSQDAEYAYASQDDVAHIEAGTVTTVSYRGDAVEVKDGVATVTKSQLDTALAQQEAGGGTQSLLTIDVVTTSKDDGGEAKKIEASQWEWQVVTGTKKVYKTDDAPETLKFSDGAETTGNYGTEADGTANVTTATLGGEVATVKNGEKYYAIERPTDLTGASVTVTLTTIDKENGEGAAKGVVSEYQYYKVPTLYETTGSDETSYTLRATAVNSSADNPYYYKEGDWGPAEVSVELKVSETTAATPAKAHYTLHGHEYEAPATLTDTYDGTDKLKEISGTVRDKDNKILTEGTDYVYVVRDSSGKVVSEAVDADTYTVTMMDPTYTTTYTLGYTLTITAAKVADAAFVSGKNIVDTNENDTDDNKTTVTYTGEEIKVTPTFYTTHAKWEKGKTDATEVKVPDTAYKTEITYTSNAAGAKEETVTEVKEPGKYTFTLTQDMTQAGAANYTFTGKTDGSTYKAGPVTFTVVVANVQATYLELDASTVTLTDEGTVLYSGTAVEPGGILYTTVTWNGGEDAKVPASAYTLKLRKATTVLSNGTASGYQTVTGGKVTGPGYYALTAIDASDEDEYDVVGYPTTYFQVVAEGSGDDVEPAAEKKDQNVKFVTKKKQSCAKGGSKQILVKGNKTAVTFSKLRGSDYLTVKKDGTLKLAKAAKSGKTYRIKVKVKAKASATYNADTEYKWFYVTVK